MLAAECETGVYFPYVVSRSHSSHHMTWNAFRSRADRSRRVQVLSMLISTPAFTCSVVSPLSKVQLNQIKAFKGK